MRNGMTLVHNAGLHGHGAAVAVVKEVVDSRTDKATNCMTPAHYAAPNGHAAAL